MGLTDRGPNGEKLPWLRLPEANGLRMRLLVAYPAASVTDPREGRCGAIWNTDRWQVCVAHTMDGSEDEIAAAIAATAPSTMRLAIDPVEVREG